MEGFWQSWIAVAVAVPVFYAIDSVLDVFFVGRNIYRSPAHATVITALYSMLFLFMLAFRIEKFVLPHPYVFILCVATGMFYVVHIYYYFSVLFKLNDAPNLECFLGFSVILVPALAYVFLDEALTLSQYIGIGISLTGVICLFVISLAKGASNITFLSMSSAVVILSLVFVLQDKMYEQVNFYTGLVLFLSGQVFAALALWKGFQCRISLKETLKYGPLFVASQILGIAAVIFSQRAISISPSVTLVVAIETTTPLFIMLFSFLAIPVLSYFRGYECLSLPILELQLDRISYKILAFFCLLVGVICTSAPDILENHVVANLYDLASDFGVTR